MPTRWDMTFSGSGGRMPDPEPTDYELWRYFIELNDFENYVYEPIDLCACYEPMFDAPADFIEEWYKEHGMRNPFACKVTRKIGNTWYIIETECGGDEPLPGMMRRLIFSDKGAV